MVKTEKLFLIRQITYLKIAFNQRFWDVSNEISIGPEKPIETEGYRGYAYWVSLEPVEKIKER